MRRLFGHLFNLWKQHVIENDLETGRFLIQHAVPQVPDREKTYELDWRSVDQQAQSSLLSGGTVRGPQNTDQWWPNKPFPETTCRQSTSFPDPATMREQT